MSQNSKEKRIRTATSQTKVSPSYSILGGGRYLDAQQGPAGIAVLVSSAPADGISHRLPRQNNHTTNHNASKRKALELFNGHILG